MDGLAWFAAFLIAITAGLVLVVAAVLLPRAGRLRTSRFYCPWMRREVVARFLTYDGTHPASVVSCTAFADPRIVTCGMPCLAETPGETAAAPAAVAGRAAETAGGPRGNGGPARD